MKSQNVVIGDFPLCLMEDQKWWKWFVKNLLQQVIFKDRPLWAWGLMETINAWWWDHYLFQNVSYAQSCHHYQYQDDHIHYLHAMCTGKGHTTKVVGLSCNFRIYDITACQIWTWLDQRISSILELTWDIIEEN